MTIPLHTCPSRRKRRKSTLVAVFLVLFLILTLRYNYDWLSQPSSNDKTKASDESGDNIQLEAQVRFWRSFFHMVLNNDPQCNQEPTVVIPEKLDIGFENDHLHNRPDVLWVETSDLERLRASHQNFVNDIQSPDVHLVYNKGTRGIVTTVSDSQIPLLIIQVRMLRATESLLPVEVFLAQPTPYADHVCKNILSSLGVTCIYLSTIFTTAKTGIRIGSYQYKVFAILFSSFDEILLLDSDAWPISNPDSLFTYPPFTNTGMIVWPDFWYASESPYYFAITKTPPADLHIKPATESGQLMYAKSKHEKSILLAAYYNYYGPQYYYPLQSQGAPGEGDKETFPLAATTLNEDFYWVRTMVNAIGRTDSSGAFFGSAMVQYDPIVDSQQHDTPPTPDITSTSHPSEVNAASRRPGKPLFIHANMPKFDPRTIFNPIIINGMTASPTRDTNGTYVRCWTRSAADAVATFGYDVERRYWEVARQVACEDLIGKNRGQGDVAKMAKEMEVCERVKVYLREVFG